MNQIVTVKYDLKYQQQECTFISNQEEYPHCVNKKGIAVKSKGIQYYLNQSIKKMYACMHS